MAQPARSLAGRRTRLNERGQFTVGSFTSLNWMITGAAPPVTTPPVTTPPVTTPPVTSPAVRFTLSRLDLDPSQSRCIPPAGAALCDATRQALWTGDLATWTAELARQGRPAPSADEVFLLTYEFRIGANDPAAIRSLAQGLLWPKIYITGVKYRGTAAGEADEYVEVTNVGGASQDMSGWRVRAVESGVDFFFTDGSALEPNARCRFYTGLDEQPDSCPGTIKVAASGVWNDAAGTAELWYDPLALLADRTQYNADSTAQPPAPNLRGTTAAAG
ncbi:MAG: lamin tail domain-containing protein [Dehalococcoidia bacterium]